MAEAVALRKALAIFLGNERFHKFVKEGVRGGRLRYWQEKEWFRFVAVHQEFAVSLDELALALRICELHDKELLPDTVEVFHGCIDYADWYTEARNRFFPHAASDSWSTEGAPFEEDCIEVWYCPVCREAKAEWESKRRAKRPVKEPKRLAKATVIVAVDYPEEVRVVEEWFAKWCDHLTSVSDDYGCGCCVNLWDVEGPEEAIRELPEIAVTQGNVLAEADPFADAETGPASDPAT